MCLYTYKNKPQVATRDIYVFKILRVSRNGFGLLVKNPGEVEIASPHRNHPWRLNHCKSAKLGISQCYVGYRNKLKWRVSSGLHAYSTTKSALRELSYWNSNRMFLFVARIPKGAEYIRGLNGDIVSTRMTVLPRDHAESVKRLGISGYTTV